MEIEEYRNLNIKKELGMENPLDYYESIKSKLNVIKFEYDLYPFKNDIYDPNFY